MAWVNTQQSEAFKDLLTLRGANGGKLRFKDMKELVDKYKQKGYDAVTRDNLYYRLHSYKTATTKDGDLVGASFSTSGRQLVLSDLSGETRSESEGTPPLNDITNTTNSNTVNTKSGSNNDAINVNYNKGGRPKGSTKAAKDKKEAVTKESITKAAILYQQACEEASKSGKKAVPKGTLERIIADVENEAGLSENSISVNTIRSRIKRGNVEGKNSYSLSPITELEPLIVEFCIRLAKIGDPLTRKTVIQLANDLVIDNDYQSRINECKSERHLQSNGLLGDAWYRGFMTWHKDKLSRKGSTVKDVKRSTWVTRENFESMYENIYESMVEAGIAEKVEEEIQYKAGHPSHYVLTKPECLGDWLQH